MQMQEIVRQHYPNAKTGAEVTETFLDLLQSEYKSNLKKNAFCYFCMFR